MVDQIPHIAVAYPDLNVPLDGRYQVLKILAAQTWVRTYLAQDLHRPSKPECVIRHFKILPTVPNYTAIVEGLFAGEATALEHLGTHSQIPRLLACFQDSNGFYTVHEWIDGVLLSEELQATGRWSAEAVVTLLQSVLSPLAFVHQSGSVHGNLKPTHLLRRLQDEQWMLIDFGGMQQIQLALATVYSPDMPPAAVQQMYQPPEQLQGIICPASDVYALGMIAIQALTGMPPTNLRLNPQTPEVLWKDHLTAESSAVQEVLTAVLDDMVQWDISKRLATAHEVQMALEERLHRSPLTIPVLSIAPVWVEEKSEQPTNIVPMIGEVSVLGQSTSDSEVALTTVETGVDRASQQKSFSNSTLRVSAGGMAVAATFAAVGWGLLNSVDWSQPTFWSGDKQASNDARAQSSETLLKRWGKQWQQGMANYRKAELAFNEKRWSEARQWATDMPDVPFWRNHGKRLAHKAIAQAEPESFQMLQSAYQLAQARNFTEALVKLEQVVPGTSVEAIAQTKQTEYREKQNIKALADLQKAYDRAILRDFTKALTYLYQIPEGTSAYTVAQQKIVEYKQKEKIRAQVLVEAADEQADQQQFLAAITALEALPPDVSLNSEVENRLAAYVAQLNDQAEYTLSLAEQQLQSGKPDAAIAMLKNVSIGTPAYAQARERLLELTNTDTPTMQQTSTRMGSVSTESSRLNPGDRLQEI